MSYLVDLAKVKFADVTDENATSWIMAMPIGNYTHPAYGKINITPERVQRFAANVNNKVRETELDIDYDHKEYGGEAAGWVKQAEPRSDGLWILVEWTKKAYEAITSKAYRYFSPEFDDAWIHPRTGEKFKDVLFGGGITNRPFLKGIQPLNLSEDYYKTGEIKLKENTNMDPEQIKALAKQLGLPETATAEMVFGALSLKLSTATPEDVAGTAPESTGAGELVTVGTGNPEAVTPSQLSDVANNPTVKKLTEALERQSKQLHEMVIGAKVKKFSDDFTATGRELPAQIENDLTKLLSDTDEAIGDRVVKLLSDSLSNAGPITGETGGSRKVLKDQAADSVKKFSEAVDKYMKDNKVSYSDAAVAVAAMDVDTFADYRSESYMREGE